MNKNIIIIVIAIVIILAGAGFLLFGNKSNVPGSNVYNQNGAPSNSSKATTEDLAFSGAVNGKMTQGYRGNTYVCSPTATGPIVGKIGDTEYTFEFVSLNAKGPGTYRATVQIGELNNQDVYYASSDASITINSDSRSGNVSGTLTDIKTGSQAVNISGSWICPPDFD